MNSYNEQRNAQVRKQILDALISMMKTQDYHSIGVSAIVETAHVGRASFYRNYTSKEDVLRQNPTPGDVSFSVKEVYPLEKAMPLFTKGVHIRLRYEDPDLKRKFESIRDAAEKNKGDSPVFVELRYENGTVVSLDLGPACRAAVNIGFLSLLAKVVPQADVEFRPEDKTTLVVREPPPWER